MALPRRKKPGQRNAASRANPEERFLEYIKSLKRHRKGRRAVLFRISLLTATYQHVNDRRAAGAEFRLLLAAHKGELIELSNYDLICILDNPTIAELDRVVIRVKTMFRDDKNFKAMEDETDFCQWFDIEQDFDQLFELARERVANPKPKIEQPAQAAEEEGKPKNIGWVQATPGEGREDKAKRIDWTRTAPPELKTLKQKPQIRYVKIDHVAKRQEKRNFEPADLDRLEQAVARMDVGPLIRKQEVKLIRPGNNPKAVFSERFVALRALQKSVLPECDITRDKLLLRHLRNVLDRRTLGSLTNLSDQGVLALGLRTSLETVVSSDFSAFHEKKGRTSQNKILLEFSIFDILDDIPGYEAARKQLRNLGYLFCIGDLDPYAFALLEKNQFPADFIKFRWLSEMADADDNWQETMKRAVREAGPHRVILCACETREALEQGLEMGVTLFSGSYIDGL